MERLLLPLVRRFVACGCGRRCCRTRARALHAGRPVVYALEKRSIVDLAVLEYVCRERNLPRPLATARLGHAAAGVRVVPRAARRASSACAWTAACRTRCASCRVPPRPNRVRSRHRAGEPVLGPRAGPRAVLVPHAGRGRLGHRRAIQEVPVAADQRPQPRDAVRRGAARCSRRSRRRAACRAGRAGCGGSCAPSSATSASATIGPDLSHRRTIVAQVLRTHAVRAAVRDEMKEKDARRGATR